MCRQGNERAFLEIDKRARDVAETARRPIIGHGRELSASVDVTAIGPGNWNFSECFTEL